MADMYKNRTLGDDLRDFKAGKIRDQYIGGAKNPNQYYYKDSGVNYNSLTDNELFAGQKESVIQTKKTDKNTPFILDIDKSGGLPSGTDVAIAGNTAFASTGAKMTSQAKKSREYEEKYKDYKYTQLKAEADKTDKSVDSGWLKEWLNSKADEVATSAELQEEYEALTAEWNKLYDTRDEEASYNRLKEIENRQNELKTLVKNRKYEEDKKKNYTDVLESNVKVKTILQKYYEIKHMDESEQITDNYSQLNGQKQPSKYSNDEVNNIEKMYQDLKNQGFNMDSLYKYYEREVNAERNLKKVESIKKSASEHPLELVGSVAANTFGSVFDAVVYAGAAIDSATGGDGYIDVNSLNSTHAQATREGVKENINSPIGQFLFDTGMSIADNVARLPLLALPGGKAINLAIAGTSAGVSSANTVIENGGSLSDALWTGGVSALAEIVFEKIPLDKLIKLKNEGTESLLKEISKQATIEGFEELGTEAVNIVTDYIINKDLSQVSLQYNNYIEKGYSEDQAWKQVAMGLVWQMGQSFAGGAISGGVLGGATGAISYSGHKLNQRKTKNYIKNISKDYLAKIGLKATQAKDFDLNKLIDQAKKGGNKKAEKYAKSMERSIKNNNGPGKILTEEIGYLIDILNTDRPTDNYEVENVDKQELINKNYTLSGELKTDITTDNTVKTKDKKVKTNAFGKNYPYGIAVKTNSGGSLEIIGVESSAKDFGASDNNVILRASNGELYNADDVHPHLVSFQQLFNRAKNFDTIGARRYISQYDTYAQRVKESGKAPDIKEYSDAFEDLYALGKMGVSYESVKASGNFTKQINTLRGIALTAVEGGNQDANLTYQNETNKLTKIRVPGERNSVNSRVYIEPGCEKSVKASEEQIQMLQAVAEKTGRDIVLTNNIEDGNNAYYNLSDGKIYIRADLNEDYMLAVALHEAVHGVRQASPLEYKTLCEFVTNYLVAKGGNIENLLDDIKIKWQNKTSTREDLLEELVCQTVMAIATDETAIKTALSLEENKNILVKVASVLKKIADKIKTFIKECTTNKQAQAWLDDAKAIQDLAEKLSKAFDVTKNTISQTTEQKNNTRQGEIKKFNIDDTYYLESYSKKQIKNWENSKKIIIYKNDKQFKSFIDEALTTPTSAQKMYFGKIPHKLASFIENETGIDVNGYNYTLRANEIKKILLNSHGNEEFENLRGHRAILKEDLLLLPQIIAKPDEIFLSEKLFEGKPVIEFKKLIGGKIRVITYVSSKHHDLTVQTMYSGKKKESFTTTPSGDNSFSHTSETLSGTAFNENISQNRPKVKENSNTKNAKYSVAGELAKTANIQKLDKAIELEMSGETSEAIRKTTGWFRGYEGKWKFEINDKDMKFRKATKQEHKNAEKYTENLERFKELQPKIDYDMATPEEEQEYYDLDGTILKYETAHKLSEYMDHPELYAAYPQLKDVNLCFNSSINRGEYNRDTNTIIISTLYRDEIQTEALIHEVQHVIQDIEGFTGGASVGYWQSKGHDFPIAYDMYTRTAGEVEASDVEKRLHYDAELRDRVRPDVDREDVVFADDRKVAFNYNVTKEDIEILRTIGGKSINEFTSADIKKSEKWAKKFYKELGTKSPFFRAWFGDWRAYDTKKIEVAKNKNNSRGLQYNGDTGWDINVSGKIFNETKSHNAVGNKESVQYLPYINDIVEKSILLDTYCIKKPKSLNSLFMHSFYAVVDLGNGTEVLKLYVEEMNDPNSDSTLKRAYQLQNIEKAFTASVRVQGNSSSSLTSTVNAINNVSDLFALVKQYDKKFKPNPVNFLLLNEDGTPKILYHGTRKQFTKFELQEKPLFGRSHGDGFYFTSDYNRAFRYANGVLSKGKDRGGIIMPVYLRMNNPYVIDLGADRTQWYKEYQKENHDGIIDLDSDTYYVENGTQIKSATDNIGTFDVNNSDIRYAIDDTITEGMYDFGEDLFDKENGIDFDKVIKDTPATAVNIIYNKAAKTAESGIKQSMDVKLEDKAYHTIARNLMSRYHISLKNNPEFDLKLAKTVKAYTEQIEEGRYVDFAGVLENIVAECKDALLLSGEIDDAFMKDERENIYGYLKGKTLLVTDYAESDVRETYGSIANYRSRVFGRVNVGLERNNLRGKTLYIDDLISFVEENYMHLTTDECDSIQGYKWLDNLLNNVLQPKYVNHYVDGFYENIDTAAIEMAFDMTTEIIDAKAKQIVSDKKADRKKLRELKKAREQAIMDREALHKSKTENYRQKLKAEQEQRKAQIKRMRERLQDTKDNNLKNKQKMQKQIDRLERVVKSQKKVINMGYDTIREQYIEGRTATIYRERLGRMLNRMAKKLDGKANNNEYIPEILKEPILKVLSSFTADPGTYKNGKKKQLPGYFGEWKNIAQIGDRVAELTFAYEELQPASPQKGSKIDYAFIDINSLVFQQGTLDILTQLKKQVKGKNIYELNADDLKKIYETMQELDESLREAVEIILDGQRVSIRAAAERGISETEGIKFKKGVHLKKIDNTAVDVVASSGRELRNKYVATHLDSVRYGRFLSGYHDDYVISRLMNDLHEGDKKRLRIIQDAFIRVQAVTMKYDNSDLKKLQTADVKEFDFKDLKNGKHVKISQGMLIAIYLTDRQTDGHRHLVNEEYNHYTVIPDLAMMNLGWNGKGDKSHRIRLSDDDLRRIKTYVENNQMLNEIAGAVSEVYNTVLADNINEVSMSKYGKRIATVKNYYPLHIYKDGAKYEKNFEAEFNDIRLKNRGFTKNRITSFAPIMIDDVLKTFTTYVKSSAEYCGMLIPIENFKKVYNSSNGDVTLHEVIVDKFGPSAEHYIEKLMADLQQAPDVLDNNWFQKAQSNFMGAKLLLNPGSAMKQFSAFPTAYKYFGAKNVSIAAAVGVAKQKELYNTYSKYTPYLWYRKEGNGAVVGELSRELGFTKKLFDKADIMGKVDQYVVGSLLYAAELHVEQTTNLRRGTDAFYKEVARQYEKCVDDTQPNNMITSKPQYIRNNVMRILSLNAFRSQNMAIANGVIDSFMEYAARRSDYNEDKSNAEAKEAKNEAAKKFARSLIGAVSSSVLNGALTVLVNLFLWHKWDDFKDKEGNVTFETIATNFIDETLESLTGTFAWGDTAYEAINYLIDNGLFYGLEVMSVEIINDFVSKLKQGNSLSAATLLADCFGIPAENGLRIARSIVSYGNDLLNGNGDIITENNSFIKNNTDHFNYIIVRAKQNGETAKAEHFVDIWKDDLINNQGKTVDQAIDIIKSKLVTALSVSDDDIDAAAVARANGDLDKYELHMNKVIGYGFDSKDVKKAVDKAIKNVITDIEERKISDKSDIMADLRNQGFNDKGCEYVYKEMQSNDEPNSLESVSVFEESDEGAAYTYSDAFEALKDGDIENFEHIKQYLIDEAGKEEKDITSAMRSASRTDNLWAEYIEAYKNSDKATMTQLRTTLTNIYESWSTAYKYLTRYQERMREKKK